MRFFIAMLLGLGCASSSGPSGVTVEVSRTEATEATVQRDIARIDVEGLKQKIDAGELVRVVDVRGPEEQMTGMVPGAISMPLGDFSPATPPVSTTDPAEPIFFICESGSRSERAARLAANAGFTAVNVEGGTAAWRARDFPLFMPSPQTVHGADPTPQ